MTSRETTVPDHETLARKLEWRRHPDEAGRYLNVFIEQNNTCNLKCRMCGFSDSRVAAVPRYHMPASVYESIARQVFPLTNYLHMSLMTEPFMTSDFPDRLMLIGKYGVPYSRVVTNGTLLTEKTIETIINSQITSFTVSIDGGTKEVYEEIRVGARFEAVLEKIGLFKKLREKRGASLPKLQINHVLMKRNVDFFDDFLALLDSIRPEQVDVRTIEPMTFVTGMESKDPEFFAKVRQVRPRFAEFCQRHGIEETGYIRDEAGMIDLVTASGHRMTCQRPWDTLAIHANGDVHPCMSWTRPPIGNLARQSFEEIWTGEPLEQLRAEFEIAKPGIDCQNCTIKKTVSFGIYDDFFFKMVNKDEAWARPN